MGQTVVGGGEGRAAKLRGDDSALAGGEVGLAQDAVRVLAGQQRLAVIIEEVAVAVVAGLAVGHEVVARRRVLVLSRHRNVAEDPAPCGAGPGEPAVAGLPAAV